MSKELFRDVPTGYITCLQTDCPRANTCLHQLAYEPLADKASVLSILNPKFCTKDDNCPHYRDSAPVTYARGFTGIQRQMFPEQYKTFKAILVRRFGRNPYFERRNGHTPISPKEQEIIRKALKRAGVTLDLQFDQYEKDINWKD